MPASFIFTFYSILILKNKIEFLEEFFFFVEEKIPMSNISPMMHFSLTRKLLCNTHTQKNESIGVYLPLTHG